MLYHQPRFSPATLVRAGLVRVVSLAAELHRTTADKAHIDGLNDAALRDLGTRRIETRDDRFYR
jgi:hypothetical protein